MRIRLATTPEARGEGDLAPDRTTGNLIAFDGRLDNRAELLERLGGEGARLRRASDAEIAMALFARFGDAFLNHLAGDFALALWQPLARRLLCARSATGWRPLLWTCDGRRFAFASEPAALVKGLGLAPRVNEAVAGEIMASRFVSKTETLWDGIVRLEPGGAVEFRGGMSRCWRWYGESHDDLSRLSDADHVDMFRSLFDAAITSCARSEGPVAAHLSGGLDSSAVFARATQLQRAGAIAGPVGAISARYPGEAHDESRWSEAVERDLGVTARIVGDAPFDLDRAADWCARSLHLPMRPNAMGPTLAASALMQATGERVLLTGEGGDDWMQGSRAHWPDLLLGGRWATLLDEAVSQVPDAGAGQRLRWLISAGAGPIVSHRRRAALKRPFLLFGSEPPAWLRPDWVARIGLVERWHDDLQDERPGSFARIARGALIAPPQRDLIFGPIQSAAAQYGVEQRHPFHDLRLIGFFMGAAGGMMRRDGVRKHLLREAMRGRLPESVRMRTDKAEFRAPVIDAMIAFFDRKPAADMTISRMGWADPDAIERLFEPHRCWRRARKGDPPPVNALNGLWFCVALDLWLEHGFGVK